MNPLKQMYGKMKDSLGRRVSRQEQYRLVFDTSPGKRVLKHICEVGMVWKPTFVSGDPHMTSLNEGKRQLALSILREVCRDQDELIQQIEKGFEREE